MKLRISPHRRTRFRPYRAFLMVLWVFGGIALLQGCATVGPDYVPPRPEMPDAWHHGLREEMDTGKAPLHTWWIHLNDPILNDLIRRAGEENLSLKTVFARIMEARAFLGVTTGELYPDINGSGTAARQRISDDLRFPGSDSTTNYFSLGVDAGWEIDFWGRVRRSIDSAQAGYQASIENYRDVLVLLFAQVGQNYVALRTLQQRLQFAIANVEVQKSTLQVTQDRFEADIAPALDVHQAELNLARTESLIPSIRSEIATTIHRLGVLIGELPATLYSLLSEPKPIPDPPEEAAMIMPAELLRRRPDIRQAERNLAAQVAQIGVATAALYPNFFISGVFTLEATSGLFDWDNRSWSLGPFFTWNLFDGGRVRSRIQVENARADQALLIYEQTVLDALEEVENALVSYSEEQIRRESLSRSVTAAEKSVELVDQLYKIGLTDFQNLLDMERSLFEQSDQLASSRGAIVSNLIRLYAALGGGWSPVTPEIDDPEPAATFGETMKSYWNQGLETFTQAKE